MKLNVHFSYAKQVIVLKVADRRAKGRPGDDNRHPPKFWLRPEKTFKFLYPAKLNILNFHPLEVLSRYHNPQLHVDENY